MYNNNIAYIIILLFELRSSERFQVAKLWLVIVFISAVVVSCFYVHLFIAHTIIKYIQMCHHFLGRLF